MDQQLRISAAVADHVSLAFHQNAVALVAELVLENDGDSARTGLTLRIVTEPAFAAPLEIAIDELGAGSRRHITPVDMPLDAAYLRKLQEATRGSLTFLLVQDAEVLAELRSDVTVLPPSHWGGTAAAPELLAAFVRPNDPAIDIVLHEASARLAAAGRSPALDGYASGQRERSWEMASAIWAAIASHGLSYVLPPASFERHGQKVRSPGDVLERRTGTCLDLALLLSAALEQAGLRAVLVLTEGHALVGLWLRKDDFASVTVDDRQVLRKRRDLDELVLIETTLLTRVPAGGFAEAVRVGAGQVEDGAPPLEVAIDLSRARARHIRPLETGDGVVADVRANVLVTGAELPLDPPPDFAADASPGETAMTEEELDRLERWKRRLLDLSLRNKLLNVKDTRKGVAIDCPVPGRLEDLLNEGVRFKLLADPEILDGKDGRDAGLFAERHGDYGRRSLLLEGLDRHELYTRLGREELDARLLDLYRVTRTAFEEGGSNILFLAVGFLKWTQREGGATIRAPLLLLPVSLQRASVRSGFRLVAHDEDVRFNPTLLQLLRQDFRLAIPELEADLPVDQSGVDVARVLRIMRTHVKDMRGWEVTEDVVLSTFSFTKFLMWRDLVERTDVLKRNRVVRHLIDTPKLPYGDGLPFPEPSRLDQDYHPREVFAPLSADSSQLAAVLSAATGKDFVLFGPPGTGKSQTIANMVSQCLANGKTVLFVSQKTAALEVVQRRLNDIGLGEFCLEVHSTKAQKSAVLEQLRQAWHERTSPVADDWEAATGELAGLREELNALVGALHRPRGNGMHAQEAFGRVTATRALFADLRFGWSEATHSPAELVALRALCRDLRPLLVAVGPLANHPLAGLPVLDWDPAWRDRMAASLDASIAALEPAKEAAATFARVVGLPVPRHFEALRALYDFGTALVEPAAVQAGLLLGPRAAALAAAIQDLQRLQEDAAAVRARLQGDYRNGVFGIDLDTALANWIAASQSNFVVRGGRQRKVAAEIQPFANGALPADLGPDLALLIELRAVLHKAEALAGSFSDTPVEWRGLDTNLEVLSPAMDWARRMRLAIAAGSRTTGYSEPGLVAHVIKLETQYRQAIEDQRFTQALDRLRAAVDAIATHGATLAQLAGTTLPTLFAGGEDWLDGARARFIRWRAGLAGVNAWAQWNRARARAVEAGLDPLVAAIEAGRVLPAEVETAFEVAYARWWADRVVAEDPVLRDFLVARHDDSITRYRALDERVAELSKRIVRARLAGRVPSPTAFGTDPEWSTLARELQKRKRHMPLRKLFSALPGALTRLTPCVMMSPLSIAQYLPADAKPFDVVIFDEASQIPAWDAIGAMARGTQVVIVGDPEQLPPTSVGERGVDDIEDGTDVEDQESILDEALVANLPRKYLDWHYRSRHESLIAFSNAAYYKGRLVTFPSPVTEDRAVRYVEVPGGVYERGGAKVNREEARAVVAEIVARLTDPTFLAARQSLGVVTFNGEQMRLIENLLDKERAANPAIEAFFDRERWHEPVFVKNLENVQGDERDIILFSVAVGPDAEGRIAATVSSLNKEGGHRRLNVAITRARREMVVFATLRPEQIDLSRSAARGVREFKHFLEFAQRGTRAMAEAFAPTGRDVESPFEDAVRAALEARGWRVQPQVGVSGFRIDLGIVDPDAPGRYLAGVECDGATYHRSATARDRDRLRAQVLASLGWRIHRVWSPDWWMDMEAAIVRLDAALRADLDAVRAEAERVRAARQAEAAGAPAADPAVTTVPTDAPVVPDVEPGIADGPDNGTPPPDGIAATPAEASQGWMPPAGATAPVVVPMEAEPAPLPDADNETVEEGAQAVASFAGHDPAPIQDEQTVALPLGELNYRRTDLLAEGFVPDAARFYDPAYRPQLRSMALSVLAAEAPVYEELLVQRIARAHGFARAGSGIREALAAALVSVVQVGEDDGRRLLWPPNADVDALVEYRPSAPEERAHGDIPICELASLAAGYIAEGADRDEAVRRMALALGLGRLRASTEARLQRAYDRGRQG